MAEKLRAESAAHTQYEGESHDVDENKGPKKALLGYPTMFMKTKGLIFVIPRYV